MREILFRGKNSNGNWIYGNLNFYPDINRTFIRKNNKDLLPSFQTSLEEEVNKKTVGQYTGLTDKNGTKIFEGDIVKIDNKYIRYIAYSGECSAFVKLRYIDISTSEFSGYLGKGYDNYKQTIEIIGNIHDNPELLKRRCKVMCETCQYYDTDRQDQPCCSCVDGCNYEECEVTE